MTEPKLSVVVASVNGFPYVGHCLDALAERAAGAEVIVADSTDDETRRRLAEGWPSAKLLTFDEQRTVPELRAAGIFASTAPFVAVIEDHCQVTPEWATAALSAHEQGQAVVGGPIRNVVTERARDWAAFFCEYSAFMEPLPEGEVRALTGMNVAYDRRAIDAMADLLRRGRCGRGWLHARLRERGIGLYCAADMVLEHDKDFGLGEFLSQRWHYSRSYAGMRSEELGRRRYLYALDHGRIYADPRRSGDRVGRTTAGCRDRASGRRQPCRRFGRVARGDVRRAAAVARNSRTVGLGVPARIVEGGPADAARILRADRDGPDSGARK